MSRSIAFSVAALALFSLGAVARAEEGKQEEKSAPAEKPADKKDAKPAPEKAVTSKHVIRLGDVEVAYQATAGVLPLVDAEGKTSAEIFYIAYTRTDMEEGAARRPLTFSFNGGPGSSSVWLHLGLLGPKRVKLQDNGFAVPPPYELVENEFSLLGETDLVFIDPVGTGYSRAGKPGDEKNFHGVKEDAASVAEFIRLYVTRNGRWPSPKFLIGESYGTTRAAALCGELAREHRMNLNGVMLVSTVLNFQTIWGGPGNDLPHVLYLPSYAATAWYHRRLEPALQNLPLAELLKQAEEFAVGDFSRALMLGHSLPEREKRAVVERAAALTGLRPEFVAASNLRIPLSRFNAELLRDQGLVVGRFDSRYTSLVRDPLSGNAERDPSADAIFGAFAATFHHYVRHDLKFEEDRPYHILAGLGRWNWGADNQFLNVAETLADSMAANPFLKVHVSNGLFDLATPYFAARYTFNQMRAPDELIKNVIQDDYESGHMMYLNLPDLKKQSADLGAFIRGASGGD